MNRIEYVPASFAPIGKEVNVKVPVGEEKGLFGKKTKYEKRKEWQQTGYSDRLVDGEKLAKDIAKKAQILNQDGFEVTAITPVTSGAYKYAREAKSGPGWGWGYGYGYGYGFTEGVVILAKQKER